jgi:hypothetical protein
MIEREASQLLRDAKAIEMDVSAQAQEIDTRGYMRKPWFDCGFEISDLRFEMADYKLQRADDRVHIALRYLYQLVLLRVIGLR